MVEKIINKLNEEGYVFKMISREDIDNLIKRNPNDMVEQLALKVKQKDYNMFSDYINDFLGY